MEEFRNRTNGNLRSVIQDWKPNHSNLQFRISDLRFGFVYVDALALRGGRPESDDFDKVQGVVAADLPGLARKPVSRKPGLTSTNPSSRSFAR